MSNDDKDMTKLAHSFAEWLEYMEGNYKLKTKEVFDVIRQQHESDTNRHDKGDIDE